MNYTETLEVVVYSSKECSKYEVEKHVLKHMSCATVVFEVNNTLVENPLGKSMILYRFKNIKGLMNAKEPEAKLIRISQALRGAYPGCKIEALYFISRIWNENQTVSD